MAPQRLFRMHPFIAVLCFYIRTFEWVVHIYTVHGATILGFCRFELALALHMAIFPVFPFKKHNTIRKPYYFLVFWKFSILRAIKIGINHKLEWITNCLARATPYVYPYAYAMRLCWLSRICKVSSTVCNAVHRAWVSIEFYRVLMQQSDARKLIENVR